MVYIGKSSTDILPGLVFKIFQTGDSCKWTGDSKWFILDNFESIQDCPTRIYASALTLCPSSSWLHKYCTGDVKVVTRPAEWGTCTRTISCSDTPYSLAHWNNTIAAGFHQGDIIFFGALTGSQTAFLSGHTKRVESLVFSLDGTFLVSGSGDKTVRLWDVQTGRVIKTFHEHRGQIFSVSISADNTMIASGSEDKTVHLCNIKTGNFCILKGHKDYVTTATFSPTNPQLLLSASKDNTVRQWGTDGHQIGSTIPGYHVAFSPDGTQFVSLNKETVTIRNTDSRMTVVEFNLADSAYWCCFSPNGRFIATIYESIGLWDITGSDPSLIQTFLGHSSYITGLVFPSFLTLTSVSHDHSIKFWQVNASLLDPSSSGTESTSLISAPIRSVSLQAENDLAFSIDSEGDVKTWDILTGCCKKSYKTGLQNILYGDMQLIDGRLILVWCMEWKEEIHVEDVEKGRLQTISTHRKYNRGLKITGDGSRILHLDLSSIKVWDMWTGKSAGKKGVGSGMNYFGSLHIDGSKFLVCSGKSIQGWDFGVPGSAPTQFPVTSLPKSHLNLIENRDEDGQRITLARIEDSVTGKEVFQLCGRHTSPAVMQWDGQYLIAGYKSGEVSILDSSHFLPK